MRGRTTRAYRSLLYRCLTLSALLVGGCSGIHTDPFYQSDAAFSDNGGSNHDADGSAARCGNERCETGEGCHSCAQDCGRCGFTTLHTLTVRSDQDGNEYTPIVTGEDGTLYFAFMDSDNKMLIGEKNADGDVIEHRISPLWAEPDQYHTTPSIGVDPKGYLHVFGPMYQTDMDYLRSVEPHTGVGGFARQHPEHSGLWVGTGSSGRKWISYPYVFYDPDGRMWVAYRARSGTLGWLPGSLNGQLARYNEVQQRWAPLGGNSNPQYTDVPGDPQPTAQCFAWTPHSSDGVAGHQRFAARPFIDHHGRLHYVFEHERDTDSASWHQDMLYAYSDDAGHTWHHADGSNLEAAPIVVPKEAVGGPMWAQEPTGGNNLYGGYVGRRGTDGAPVVAYNRRSGSSGTGTTRFAVYEEGGWIEHDTGEDWFPGRLLIDRHNVWTFVAGRRLYVSVDNGASWTPYDSGIAQADGENANVDTRYFVRSGKIRFVAKTIGETTVRIVEFISEAWRHP